MEAENTPTAGPPPTSQNRKPLSNWWLLALVPLSFAEFGTTISLTRWLGAPIAFALYAVPALAGLFAAWRLYPKAKSRWRHPLELKGLAEDERNALIYDPAWQAGMGRYFAYWTPVWVMLVPGVISHLVAFFMLLRCARDLRDVAMDQSSTFTPPPEPLQSASPLKRGYVRYGPTQIRLSWVLLLLVGPFAEVAVTVLLTRWLGATPTFALYVISAGIGLLVQCLRYRRLGREWDVTFGTKLEPISEEAIPSASEIARQRGISAFAMFWVTSALLLIPGVLSHLAAFYWLIWPPVWKWNTPKQPEPAA